MAWGAQIIGATQLHLAQDREHGLGTQSQILGAMAAGARQSTLIGSGFVVLQQLLEGHGSHLMESRPQAHLYRFQIGLPQLVALGEDAG